MPDWPRVLRAIAQSAFFGFVFLFLLHGGRRNRNRLTRAKACSPELACFLKFLFRLSRKTRPGNCLQSFGFDRLPCGLALAIGSVSDPVKRLINLIDGIL